MKTTFTSQLRCLCLAAGIAGSAWNAPGQDIAVRPSRGGGLDTNAPMIHVDILYDYAANEMRAILDTTKGVPKLTPLPAGYTFDTRSNYSVLNGKAYNLQYAWNPGGIFTNPPGAALWIECLSASPELDVYDGPGNKMVSPPRTYAPILGTAGSDPKWQWYGSMAHNSYAVRNPTNSVLSAQYRIYFGDAQTGAPDAFAGYDDAIITLTWTVDVPVRIHFLDRQEGTVGILFEGDSTRTYHLERCSALEASAPWQTIAGPLSGTNCLQTLIDPSPPEIRGFYRLRVTAP